MADISNEGAHLSAGIDLSQFFQVFFEEAGENLDTMEQMLLALDIDSADDEELNAIFRCAHSVKGGAATFGFNDVAELTHEMETLLDKLRRHELTPTAAMVDVLLASGDALKAQLARHQGNGADAHRHPRAAGLDPRHGSTGRAAPAAGRTPRRLPRRHRAAAPRGRQRHQPLPRTLELTVGPLEDLALADNLVDLFKEITDLGTIEPLDAGQAGRRHAPLQGAHQPPATTTCWTCSPSTSRASRCSLAPLGAGYGFHEGAPGAPAAAAAAPATDPGYGFFDDAPGRPAPPRPPPAPAAAAPAAGGRTGRRPGARCRAQGREGRPPPNRARCACRSTRSTS